MGPMKRYMIERDIPGIGEMSATELGGAAKASTKAIEQIGSDVQWQHSYVAADKTYCVYLAKDEAAIHRHAKLSGIPLTNITALIKIIDPLTANT
jgi:uncharacterized protein DUF4242